MKKKTLESIAGSKFRELSKSELKNFQGGNSTNVSIRTHVPGTSAGTMQTALQKLCDSNVDTVAVDDSPQGTIWV